MKDVTIDNQQERHTADLNWLAAAWEADGWFSLRKASAKNGGQFTPQCGFTNVDPLFIGEVISILKLHNIPYYQRTKIKNGLGKKEKTEILVQGMKRVDTFLSVIIPFLRTSKKERATIIMQFIKHRLSAPKTARYGDFEEGLFYRMRELNGYELCESSETLCQASVISC